MLAMSAIWAWLRCGRGEARAPSSSPPSAPPPAGPPAAAEATLAIVVSDDAGPVVGASWWVDDRAGPETNADGYAALTVPLGVYTLEVRASHHATWTARVVHLANQDVHVRLEPAPAVPLTLLAAARGNFLMPFFGPAWGVKADRAGFVAYCRQLAARGDRLVLLNAQQDDWGPENGCAAWTGPQAGAWDVEDFRWRCRVARSCGLQVVCGLLDQGPLRADWRAAVRRAAAFAAAIRDEVCAFWSAWELDEVLEESVQHSMHAALREAVGSVPCGPHFAAPLDLSEGYWAASPATVHWAQYGFDVPLERLGPITRTLAGRLRGQLLVAAEHTLPTHRPCGAWTTDPDDRARAHARAEACLQAGAVASLNG